MKKAKTVWITRESGFNNEYEMYRKKPIYSYLGGYWHSNSPFNVEMFCASLFEKVTGIKLKGGSKSIIKGHFKFVREK